jgi:hypothetical protein
MKDLKMRIEMPVGNRGHLLIYEPNSGTVLLTQPGASDPADPDPPAELSREVLLEIPYDQLKHFSETIAYSKPKNDPVKDALFQMVTGIKPGQPQGT